MRRGRGACLVSVCLSPDRQVFYSRGIGFASGTVRACGRTEASAPTNGTGGTDCHSQCAHWLRNDMVFCKGCGGLPMVRRGGALPLPRATARVAPTEGLPIELRRGRRPRRPAPVTRGAVRRAKNKIAPGFCQGRCAAPWYHLASRPAHAGGLMKCRYTSALLRAPPSEPKAQEALDPAAPEPCSPVRPAPAFTYSGSLGRSANGVLFPSLPF